MNPDNQNLFVKLALLAGGAYAIYWFLTSGFARIGTGAAKALTSTGEAIGGKLYDLFHPGPVGESLFYTVQFPNGARHAIASSKVEKDGRFQFIQSPYANTRWQIVIDKTGRKFAHPV